jgi:predicted PurR-regulated permease PerM
MSTNDNELSSQHSLLRQWLPHVVMLALIASATWLVATVFAPLGKPLLVAAALAALTHRVVMTPTQARIDRLLPRVPAAWRCRLSAIIATSILLFLAATPVLVILVDALGGIGHAYEVIVGLMVRDPHMANEVADALAGHAQRMHSLYPAFPITPAEVHAGVLDMLVHSQASAFYAYLFRGTGGLLAQGALTIILLCAFFERGRNIAERLLLMAPFTESQREEFSRRFQHTTLRLLHDTVAMALMRGLALGLIAWLVADFPIGVVAAIAAFVGLVPVVGYASVWIPLSSLVWSRGEPWHAVALALASLSSWWLIGQLGQRMVRDLDTNDSWPGFLLFLGIVGGVLSFGWTGLVVGPMAVVVLRVLLGFWLPLYGVGTREPDTDTDTP